MLQFGCFSVLSTQAFNITACFPKCCGYRTFVVENTQNVKKLLNEMKNDESMVCSALDDNGMPTGLVYFDRKLALISKGSTQQGSQSVATVTVTYVAREQIELVIDDENDFVTITKYVPNSVLFDTRLTKSQIPYRHEAHDHQAELIEIIKNNMKFDGFTVFIHGLPGAKKSEVMYLLAKEINASILTEYSPLIAGRNINEMYAEICPTKDKWLIIDGDEFDSIVVSAYKDKLNSETDFFARHIYNKQTFNKYMDNISKLPFTILLATSNRTIEDIHMEISDNSALRRGRVHIYVKNFGAENMKIQYSTEEKTDIPWLA